MIVRQNSLDNIYIDQAKALMKPSDGDTTESGEPESQLSLLRIMQSHNNYYISYIQNRLILYIMCYYVLYLISDIHHRYCRKQMTLACFRSLPMRC